MTRSTPPEPKKITPPMVGSAKTAPGGHAAESTEHWFTQYIGNLRRITPAARWYLLGAALIGVAWSTFMLLFNLYLKERGFGEGIIGRVLSLQSFGTVLAALPAAALVARHSARAILVVASLGVAGGFVAQTLVGEVNAILIAACATGGFLAVARVVGAPFLMQHSTPSERAHVFSLSFAVMLGSGLITHFAAGSLHRLFVGLSGSSLIAYRWVLLLGCSSAVLSAVAFTRMPPGVVGEKSMRMPLREFWEAKGKLLFKLTFPFFLVGMGAGLIIPFLNLYFRDRFGLTPQTIGFYYGLVQASMILGVMLGPELARRFGMIRTIVYTEWASIPFMIVLAFTHHLALATVAFLLRGALMNLGVPISNNYMMERVGLADRAMVNSYSMIAWSLSWAVTTGIGGLLIEHGGYETPLLLACGLYVVASAMYFSFFHAQDIYAGRAATTGGARPGDE
jgi:MFS family permease